MNPVDARYMLLEIRKSDYKPTAWEKRFLNGLRSTILDKRYLTHSQAEVLKKIKTKSVTRNMPSPKQYNRDLMRYLCR